MNETRRAFLEAVDASREVLGSTEVAARWEEPSALAEFSVRGLAGHVARASTTVVDYLAGPEPEGEAISAPLYFARLPAAPAVKSEQQASIRRRGDEMAAAGATALCDRLDAARSELEGVLAEIPSSRKVKVYGDQIMNFDDYLLTRIVELLVHTDDLAVSVGFEQPALPGPALSLALPYLLEVTRARSGDLAVLRAFSRRERDGVQALRVF